MKCIIGTIVAAAVVGVTVTTVRDHQFADVQSVVVQHTATVTGAIGTAVTTVAPTAMPTMARPTPTPWVDLFDCPGSPSSWQDSYAMGADIICPRGQDPPLIYRNALTTATCPYYIALVRHGQLAAEVVADPASPCYQQWRQSR